MKVKKLKQQQKLSESQEKYKKKVNPCYRFAVITAFLTFMFVGLLPVLLHSTVVEKHYVHTIEVERENFKAASKSLWDKLLFFNYFLSEPEPVLDPFAKESAVDLDPKVGFGLPVLDPKVVPAPDINLSKLNQLAQRDLDGPKVDPPKEEQKKETENEKTEPNIPEPPEIPKPPGFLKKAIQKQRRSRAGDGPPCNVCGAVNTVNTNSVMINSDAYATSYIIKPLAIVMGLFLLFGFGLYICSWISVLKKVNQPQNAQRFY